MKDKKARLSKTEFLPLNYENLHTQHQAPLYQRSPTIAVTLHAALEISSTIPAG